MVDAIGVRNQPLLPLVNVFRWFLVSYLSSFVLTSCCATNDELTRDDGPSPSLLRLASICHTLRWGRLPREGPETGCLNRLSEAKGW